jgi:hypothetical protein
VPTIFEVIETIGLYSHSRIYIEAGWLNKKSNYHPAQGPKVREAIARNVGENHAVGKLLVEYCEHEGVEFEAVKPYASKIDSKTFKRISGWQGRTNQEKRDAAMLVINLKGGKK